MRGISEEGNAITLPAATAREGSSFRAEIACAEEAPSAGTSYLALRYHGIMLHSIPLVISNAPAGRSQKPCADVRITYRKTN
jgi:hypothetical protein